MQIELCIGLCAGRDRYPIHIAILEAVKVLAWNIVDSRVFEGEEDCLALSATVPASQGREEILLRVHLLAIRLKQDCIACYAPELDISENIGPRPWTWVPEYFRRCNGQRLESNQTRLPI